jgi:hypothetical protein
LRGILKIKWYYIVFYAIELRRADIAPIDFSLRAARFRCFGHVVRIQKERIPTAFCTGPLTLKAWKLLKRQVQQKVAVLYDADLIAGAVSISLEAAEHHASDRIN